MDHSVEQLHRSNTRRKFKASTFQAIDFEIETTTRRWLFFRRDDVPHAVHTEETRVWQRLKNRWINVHVHRSSHWLQVTWRHDFQPSHATSWLRTTSFNLRLPCHNNRFISLLAISCPARPYYTSYNNNCRSTNSIQLTHYRYIVCVMTEFVIIL